MEIKVSIHTFLFSWAGVENKLPQSLLRRRNKDSESDLDDL